LLSPEIRTGYPSVNLKKKGMQSKRRVHRLVAIAFLDNPENKPQVNHIDGCKTNNHLSNLEWATASENSQHAHDIGLNEGMRGSKSPVSKIYEDDVLAIKALYEIGMLQKDIAKQFKVHPAHISRIINKKRWGHM
jgi:hypothetical protein